MRRMLIVAGAVSALVLAGLLPAGANGPATAQTDDQRAERSGKRIEPLDLACYGIDHPDHRGIGCMWSEARHPHFARYQLLRAERGSEPVVVHTAERRSETRFFDPEADPSQPYWFKIEALDPGGQVIGASRPVPVQQRHAKTAPQRDRGTILGRLLR